MSFLDGLGMIAGAAVEETRKKARNILEEKEKMERFSDETLLRRLRSASGDKRLAMIAVLKERGLTSEDIHPYLH